MAGTPTGGYIQARQYVYSAGGPVTKHEKYLAEHLTSAIPVITVANPAAQFVQGSSVRGSRSPTRCGLPSFGLSCRPRIS